jgi:hypothetical protein
MKGSKTFEWFNKQIQNKAQSKVEESIVKDLYKMLFFTEPQWVNYFDESYCIVGFSEDKYDYYWVCINNKDKKLHFITYLYKLEPSEHVTKTWNKDEKRNIRNFVNEYFRNYKNENLIYLNDYINSFEAL